MYNINWCRIVCTPMSSWWDFKPTSAFRFQRVPQSQVGKALSAKENEFGNVHQGVNLDKNKWVFLFKTPKTGWCPKKQKILTLSFSKIGWGPKFWDRPKDTTKYTRVSQAVRRLLPNCFLWWSVIKWNSLHESVDYKWESPSTSLQRCCLLLPAPVCSKRESPCFSLV